jgi:gluconate kinase
MSNITEEKLTKIEGLLENERKDWSSKIQDLVGTIDKAHEIAKSQTLMLSYRHMIVDKIIELNILLGKKRANDANFKKMRYQHYKTNHDVRLQHNEIMEYIMSDMSLRIREASLIENQISYYKQAIETLDKMGFAIKNRVILATNDI